MSETKKDEYIEINLSKIFLGTFVAIYKNSKVLLVTLILGCLLTIIFAFILSTPTYVVKQMIQTPSYFDGKKENNILNDTKINIILQSMLKHIQEKSPNDSLLQNIKILYPYNDYTAVSKDDDKEIIKNDNYLIKQRFDQQKMFFSLFVISKYNDSQDISKLYTKLLKEFSESSVIKKEISIWKKGIENKIELSSESLKDNEELVKRNKEFMTGLLNKQTNILGMYGQSQSMILKYIGNIDDYQKQIFSLQNSISLMKFELNNIEPTLLGFGDPFIIEEKGKSKLKLLLIGFCISLIFSILCSLGSALFKRVSVEAKKS